MRVILLGASGFIGSHLRARLERDGHGVIPVGRSFQRPLVEEDYDTIINCAGALTDVNLMYWTNTCLVEECLVFARTVGARFIHLGSSSETGPIEGARSEDAPCRPTTIYEATKVAATALCLGYAGQYPTMGVSVVRPFTVYGSGDADRKLLPTLWRAWRDGAPFTCYPGGHDWIHVDDFVEGVLAVLAAPPEVTRGQVFNLGTGISTSNADVVALFNRHVGGAGVTVTHSTGKLHPYDVTDWRADTTKARAVLGWQSRITLDEGIKRFVMDQWFSTSGGETAPGL